MRAPDISVHGDARLAAEMLVAELENRSYRNAGYRVHEVQERIASFNPMHSFQDRSTSGTLDPRTLMAALDRVLPRGRCLVVDSGHHINFSCAFLQVHEPSAFIFPVESFSIGLGMGTAIGAAIARPDRPTVLETGDGALMMTLGDLETAVRYKLPLVVVVCNNGGFGSEMGILRALGMPEESARFPTPSFAAIAKSIGAEGFTIATLDDLAAVGTRLGLAADRPIVLDCIVNPDVRVDSLFLTAAS